MRDTKRWGVPRILAPLLATAALACGQDCIAGTGCGGPVTYTVALDAPPANLGALILAIETTQDATVSILSGRAVPASLGGTGPHRAIVLAIPSTGPVASIRFESLPARPPTARVLEAAANQSGGYAQIPGSSVRLRVEERSGG